MVYFICFVNKSCCILLLLELNSSFWCQIAANLKVKVNANGAFTSYLKPKESKEKREKLKRPWWYRSQQGGKGDLLKGTMSAFIKVLFWFMLKWWKTDAGTGFNISLCIKSTPMSLIAVIICKGKWINKTMSFFKRDLWWFKLEWQ